MKPNRNLLALGSSLIFLVGTIGQALAAKLDVEFVENDFNWATAANITNSYWPLGSGGNSYGYYAESEDGCAYNLITVTGNTKNNFSGEYSNVVAREVTDLEWVDEDCKGDHVLTEKTTDWYAQDIIGNIWYFGEETEAYDGEEECPSSGGAWEAGNANGADAGIVLLANPIAGLAYQQELDEGNAEDKGKVLRLDASISIELPYESGPVCLKTKEWTPLDTGHVEHKYYCKVADGGVGLMLINELMGKTVRVEYIGAALPPGDFPTVGECPED